MDLAEGECNINDQNHVTNDDTTFDAPRLDIVCIRLSLSFVSKLSERIPVY
jgi:hypothetical protein